VCTTYWCNISIFISTNLPTNARITVNKGAAGNAIVIFISNICRKSTKKGEILGNKMDLM
jgi:hypothetical protein